MAREPAAGCCTGFGTASSGPGEVFFCHLDVVLPGDLLAVADPSADNVRRELVLKLRPTDAAEVLEDLWPRRQARRTVFFERRSSVRASPVAAQDLLPPRRPARYGSTCPLGHRRPPSRARATISPRSTSGTAGVSSRLKVCEHSRRARPLEAGIVTPSAGDRGCRSFTLPGTMEQTPTARIANPCGGVCEMGTLIERAINAARAVDRDSKRGEK